MNILAPASAQGRSRLDEHVAEVLEMLVSKERFSGVVSKISGTTTFITSGDGREFLAWSKPELTVGTPVEFSIDQLQAVRVKVRKETAVVEVLAESKPGPASQPVEEVPTADGPEVEEVEEPTTTVAAAFHRLFKS